MIDYNEVGEGGGALKYTTECTVRYYQENLSSK